MLGKRPPPLIRKLSELLLFGVPGRAGTLDTSTSPRSPLDFKTLKSPSPRGLKSYDLGGVGLGIVAALEKQGQPKNCICSPRLHRPAEVSSAGAGVKMGLEDWEMESETFTYVTCHEPGKSFTKVYYDSFEYQSDTRHEVIRCSGSYFHGGRRDSRRRIGGEEGGKVSNFQTLDFLSSCHLCGKNLHGKDVFMYRGEKGFCSAECRSIQMVSDERKEQCGADASSKSRTTTSVYVSGSPYNADGSNIFFSAGILAI